MNGACGAVVDAMDDGSAERRAAVARSIAEVEQQLPAELDDLTAFLQALQRLLAGESPAAVGEGLAGPYDETFDRVVHAIEEPQDHHEHLDHTHDHDHVHAEVEGRRMGLGEVLDELVQDTVRVMQEGSREDRAQMAQGLELLRLQAVQVMEWPAFAEFLQALQQLLRGEQIEQRNFEAPFDHAWNEISDRLIR